MSDCFPAQNSTASVEGAETAATIGIPAASAFCTISNEARPLTRRRCRSKRKRSVEERSANHLVHGVVASDVFARNFQFAVRVENSGGMNSAGAREIALRVVAIFPEAKAEFRYRSGLLSTRYRRKILPDRVNACLSAKTATAGNCPERCAEFSFNFTPPSRSTITLLSRSARDVRDFFSTCARSPLKPENLRRAHRHVRACAWSSPEFCGRYEFRAVLQSSDRPANTRADRLVFAG